MPQKYKVLPWGNFFKAGPCTFLCFSTVSVLAILNKMNPVRNGNASRISVPKIFTIIKYFTR